MLPDDQPPKLDYASPENQPKRLRRIFLALLGLLALVVILAWTLRPQLGYDRENHLRLKSMVNLRQIGLAIMQYSNDHQGALPNSFPTIVLNEDVTSDVFVSPRTSDTPAAGPTTQATANQLMAGGHCSYIYLGKGLTTATVTPDTVLAYEPPTPASGGSQVLFGDFHVEWEDAIAAAKLVAKAATTKSPVTMPSN